uniref:EB1 C-terminal domain-containing protein n=1 Tax=Parastrongyloides trichosuri TaxID=131310 RepID=A0A0N4ZEJ1_PARTI
MVRERNSTMKLTTAGDKKSPIKKIFTDSIIDDASSFNSSLEREHCKNVSINDTGYLGDVSNEDAPLIENKCCIISPKVNTIFEEDRNCTGDANGTLLREYIDDMENQYDMTECETFEFPGIGDCRGIDDQYMERERDLFTQDPIACSTMVRGFQEMVNLNDNDLTIVNGEDETLYSVDHEEKFPVEKPCNDFSGQRIATQDSINMFLLESNIDNKDNKLSVGDTKKLLIKDKQDVCEILIKELLNLYSHYNEMAKNKSLTDLDIEQMKLDFKKIVFENHKKLRTL